MYLSLDVLVGLRIVDEQFPTARAGNQHGAHQGAWDRTGTITKQLPHASYSVRVDGSGRISQRTRQHLRQVIPNDSLTTRNVERTVHAHAEQDPGRQSQSQANDRQRRDASPLPSQAGGHRLPTPRGDPNEWRAQTPPAARQESPIGEDVGAGLRTPASYEEHDFGDRGMFDRY